MASLDLPLRRLSGAQREKVKAVLRETLAAMPEVRLAYLHGSFAEGRPFRDVDVAVYLAAGRELDPLETAWTIAERLEAALRRAGYALPVDVQVLNAAPIGFRYHAQQGEVLLSRDEDFRTRQEVITFAQYMDMLPLLRQALKEATEWD